jgi:hypothetical protein
MKRELARLYIPFFIFSCESFVAVHATEGAPDNPMGEFAAACTDTAAMADFLLESNTIAYRAADRSPVLETLKCIAESARDDFFTLGALLALCHLSTDNETLQNYLLAVVMSERPTDAARTVACQMLVYVADSQGRDALRTKVVRAYPASLRAPECQALVEMGDATLADFLDEAVEHMGPNDPNRTVAARYVRQIRIQSGVESILAELDRDETDLRASWLVQQAFRHGATREKVRGGVLAHLRRNAGNGRSVDYYALAALTKKAELFVPADVEYHPRFRRILERGETGPDEGFFPPWATRLAKLRDEFYGLTRIQNEPAARPAEDGK